MATLTIGGRKVTVDDSFLSLPPDQQAAAVEEISASFGSSAAPQGEKKFGLGDTWPARLAKSIYGAVTLPGDVYQGAADVPQSANMPGGETTESMGRVVDLATLAAPRPPAVGTSIAQKAVPAPTQKELLDAAKGGYDSARSLGVEISPAAMQTFGAKVRAGLEEKGINAELAPKTFSTLSKLDNAPPGSVVTISNFETLRRTLGNAAGDFLNKTEQSAATRAIRELDDYLATLPARDVVRGPADEAAKVLSDARGNFAAAQRSQKITDELDSADLRAAAANSGQNVSNTVRQRLRSVLDNPKASRGYSPDELAQMERVVRGTPVGNTARFAGNLLGGGGGLGAIASAAVGGMAAPPWGALAPAVGYGLKKISNASVDRQAKLLDEMVRKRSPLADVTGANAPQAPFSLNGAQVALLRSLLATSTPSAVSLPWQVRE
jgi:hypothetical protein